MESRVNTIVPLERLGVIIGKEGEVKERVERQFQVTIRVSSESGVVEVAPREGSSDPTTVLRARDVVTAIGRGFAPEKAFMLVDDDIVIDFIDLRALFGKSESDIKRIKGRVIGREGKIRRLIEELTEADVVVYGHTIGMLGEFEAVSAAREAIEMIIKGKQHSTVYKFLRRRKVEAKRRKTLELWEKPVRV